MGLFDAIASTVGNITDNVVGMVNQNHQNKVNLRMMREQNQFNAEQSQLQRDWQESMWSKNNEYNSPEAMISRGLNPYLQGSGAMAGSSPASGGSAASAASTPSAQAFRPDFSSVFSSLASLAEARASEASAAQTKAVTPHLRDYYRGLTNWKNLAVGDSGYWNKHTGRVSAELDQSTEAQELKNLQFAERVSAAQETQILLNSDAQRVINKYMDQSQQAELFLKAQTLVNLQLNGAFTESKIKTELQRAILTAAQAKGQNISNKVADSTADSLIKASKAAYQLEYRDAVYDSKNVKLRKHLEYDTNKARKNLLEYGADLERKKSRTHYWESVSRGLSGISSGAGNIIGSFH